MVNYRSKKNNGTQLQVWYSNPAMSPPRLTVLRLLVPYGHKLTFTASAHVLLSGSRAGRKKQEGLSSWHWEVNLQTGFPGILLGRTKSHIHFWIGSLGWVKTRQNVSPEIEKGLLEDVGGGGGVSAGKKGGERDAC